MCMHAPEKHLSQTGDQRKCLVAKSHISAILLIGSHLVLVLSKYIIVARCAIIFPTYQGKKCLFQSNVTQAPLQPESN